MALKTPSQLFIKLQASGVNMPLLGLGTYQIKEADQVRVALRTAIETGYRLIDTAFAYGNEQMIGEALKKDIFDKGLIKRDELFVTTKLFSSFHRRHRVIDALKLQLKSLRLQYVDLYLIHFPIPFFYEVGGRQLVYVDKKGHVVTDPGVKLEDTWRGMEDCVKAGLARSIGLSNCNANQVDRIVKEAAIRPDVNQIEIHPAFHNSNLVNFCQEKGVMITAYSQFGSPGTLSTSGQPMSDLKLLENETLKRIGLKYGGKTPAQIICQWLVQRNIAAIPKSVTPSRIFENFHIWDFQLDKEDLATISQLDANKRVMAVIVPGIDDHPEYPFKSHP